MGLCAQQIPELVIRPTAGWRFLDLSELWAYRELIYFLTWRDIKVRYKQAALGVVWVVIQPLLTMIVFSVIFGQIARLPSDGIPYPVFSFVGLLPWQLFAGALQRASASLVGNAHLLTKVYFPRLIIPISAAAAGLLDFVISLVVLVGLMAYYGIVPTWATIWLPFLVLFALMTALAVGLWLSALMVSYRDVQYVVPFLVQIWMYASPVAYSASLVPGGAWRIVYGLNPMVGVVQGFRWALLNGQPPDELMLVSVVIVLLLLVTGLLFFRHTEETFADVV